ncbi:NlpC/P60 family protein [Streptomyces sp. NPDC015171]|uniref:C40 family peptidase n=1 Tax=Streptomyces sp. NPDC015171 TaxID=3364945 RepID=UPI0036F54736
MASHRKPRPGGTHGAGIRTPALATAALTSVAVFSQTAEAAPAATGGQGRPSREEIERKIDDLYRRAESAAETSATDRERAERGERNARTERAARTDRTDRADRTDEAEAPRRRADSLQRLRDEVARRARHRALPTQRGAVPAQRGTLSAPDTAAGSPLRDTGGIPLVGDTGGIPLARETGGIPSVRDTAGVPTLQDAALAPSFQGAAGIPSARHAAGIPSVQDAAVAPPVHGRGGISTSPRGTAVAPPAVDAAPATAAGAPADSLPGDAASGPKTAKASVQKKLAHARVLLSRQTSQAPGTPSGAYATKARKAIAFARAQLGKPCVWGAAGPGSYDCSGLTQAAWKSAGVTLPRTAREQAAAGTPVPAAQARPGDLVFFHDDVSHVGLCTGDGMMIHAPRPGAYVREEPVTAAGEAAVHSVVRPD